MSSLSSLARSTDVFFGYSKVLVYRIEEQSGLLLDGDFANAVEIRRIQKLNEKTLREPGHLVAWTLNDGLAEFFAFDRQSGQLLKTKELKYENEVHEVEVFAYAWLWGNVLDGVFPSTVLTEQDSMKKLIAERESRGLLKNNILKAKNPSPVLRKLLSQLAGFKKNTPST